MEYIFYYIIIGVITSYVTWFWDTTKHKDLIKEGNICIYLFMCTLLWPLATFATIVDVATYYIRKI
jgi:hypothetical protein